MTKDGSTASLRVPVSARKPSICSGRPWEGATGKDGSACTEEVKALLPCLPAYLRNYVPFGFLTRWRKGEIVGLGWTNVDRSGDEIRLDPEP